MNSTKISIIYPYNEILPRKKAHDLFIAHECAALQAAGFDVTLLCGKGSLSDRQLFEHYGTSPFPIRRLPIVRKNNPFNISWNRLFFAACQKKLKGVVITSVLKQAHYHLKRRLPHVTYLYEVHQLSSYDGTLTPLEKEVFTRADRLIVTTEQLKACLNVPTPIDVLPLATHHTPLPPIEKKKPFIVAYVGQLYKGQGVEQLLRAATGIELRIIGGKKEEISRLQKLNPQARFYGFCSPAQLSEIVKEAHAFVAPFELTGRMPYVAHTKLHDYAAWKRPVIAPDTPVVREALPSGAVYYRKGELKQALEEVQNRYEELQHTPAPALTWKERAERYRYLLTAF